MHENAAFLRCVGRCGQCNKPRHSAPPDRIASGWGDLSSDCYFGAGSAILMPRKKSWSAWPKKLLALVKPISPP